MSEVGLPHLHVGFQKAAVKPLQGSSVRRYELAHLHRGLSSDFGGSCSSYNAGLMPHDPDTYQRAWHACPSGAC